MQPSMEHWWARTKMRFVSYWKRWPQTTNGNQSSTEEDHMCTWTRRFIRNSSPTCFNHKAIGAANVSAIHTPTSACNSCGGHTNDDCQDTTFLRSLKTNMQTTLTTSNDLTIPTPIHTTPDGETTQIFLGATTSWSLTTFNNNINHSRWRNQTWMKHWHSFQQVQQLIWRTRIKASRTKLHPYTTLKYK